MSLVIPPRPQIKRPSIDVVITNYNCARYVADAIRSVAHQSYGDFQAVILDDVSTDDSQAVIRAELDRLGDTRFSFVALSENRGQMSAIKSGFDRVSAPFFAMLDSDDIWHPRYLEAHVKAHLNCARSAGFTASDMAIIDRDGHMVMGTVSFHGRRRGEASQDIPPSYLPSFNDETPVFGVEPEMRLHTDVSWKWPWVGTSAMVFRRALLSLIFPDQTDAVRISADFYLAFMGQFISGSILIGETLGYYRIHGENGFATNHLLGGTTPLSDRSQSESQRMQQQMIITKFVQDRARLEKAIGERRYHEVMSFLAPHLQEPRLRSPTQRSDKKRRRRLWPW